MQPEDDLLKNWILFWDSGVANPTALTRLILLEMDVISLRFALHDFTEAYKVMISCPQNANAMNWAHARVFHHAKTFVVVMRRFARLLEAAQSRAREYPPPIAEAISLAWKSSRAFLKQYETVRNAIEHIDGEVSGSNHRYINLWGDQLEVVDGKRVRVSNHELKVVERAWRRIIDAVSAPAQQEQLHIVHLELLTTLRRWVRTLEENL